MNSIQYVPQELSPNKRKCPFASPLKTPPTPEASKRPRLLRNPPRNLNFEIEKNLDCKLEAHINSIKDLLKMKMADEPEEAKKLFDFIEELSASEIPKEQKFAELGLLYFYIIKSPSLKEMPQKKSYIEARHQEIEQIAGHYKYSHKMNCSVNLAKVYASGSTAYTLRAFARMILVPDGTFNRAGCYAVKELLNSSLSKHLCEEMHEQILSIIEQLINDPLFVELLLKPCQIHPKMNEIICIDLKLKKGTQVTPYQVRWHLLITLFSLVGQMDEGNCPAVSIMLNSFRNSPSTMLELAREIISKATFTFEGCEIPILPLLATKRKYEPDFVEEVRPATAKELMSVQLVHRMLDIPLKEDQLEVKTMNDFMQTQFEDEMGIAKEIAISLKVNLLQQSILSVLQFVTHNGTDFGTSSRKKFHTCLKKLLSSFSQDYATYTDIQTFEEKILQASTDLLWFVDYRDWSYYEDHGKICFPSQPQGIKFSGEPDFVFHPFSFMRRLSFLKNDTLIPIDTISGLTKTLLEISDLIFSEENPLRSKLQSFLEKTWIRENIGNFVAEHNALASPLEGKRYYESDSLFFIDSGGHIEVLLHWDKLRDNFEKIHSVVRNSQCPNLFFSDICTLLRAHIQNHPDVLKHPNPLLLTYYHSHVFNLTPASFAPFLQSDPAEQLNEKVVERSNLLMNKTISWEMKTRLIKSCFSEARARSLIKLISKRESSYSTFRDDISFSLNQSELDLIDAEINRKLTTIEIEEFMKHIPSLLSLIGKSEKIEEFQDYICDQFDRDTYSILLLAHLIHKAFCNLNYPYFTLSQIECMLSDLLQLPQTIDIGNLNWVSELTEKLNYHHLIIKHNIAKGIFEFFVRYKYNEEPLEENYSNEILNEVHIFYPNFSNKELGQ